MKEVRKLEIKVQIIECRQRGMGPGIMSVGYGVFALSRRQSWIDLDQNTFLALNLESNMFVEVQGATHQMNGLIMAFPRAANHHPGAYITATLSNQLGVSSGDFITLRKVMINVAEEVSVAPININEELDHQFIRQFMRQKLLGEELFIRDLLHIYVENSKPLCLQVRSTVPSGIVIIQNGTKVEIQDSAQATLNPIREEEIPYSFLNSG